MKSLSLKRAPVFFFSFFPANFGICPYEYPYLSAAYHIMPRVIFYATCQLLIRRAGFGIGKSSFDPEVEVILSGYATSTSGLILLDQVYE